MYKRTPVTKSKALRVTAAAGERMNEESAKSDFEQRPTGLMTLLEGEEACGGACEHDAKHQRGVVAEGDLIADEGLTFRSPGHCWKSAAINAAKPKRARIGGPKRRNARIAMAASRSQGGAQVKIQQTEDAAPKSKAALGCLWRCRGRPALVSNSKPDRDRGSAEHCGNERYGVVERPSRTSH